MIFCPRCQTANRLGSNYCNHCGARLPASAEGPAAGPPSAQPAPPVSPETPASEPPPEVVEWVQAQPWLRGEEEAAGEEVESDTESLANLLGGLQGSLPAETWAARLRLGRVLSSAEAPPELDEDTLAALRDVPPRQEAPSPPRSPGRLGRPPRLLWLILLLVLLLVLLLQPLFQPDVPIPAASEYAQQAWQTLNALPANAIVLVAWDFDPTTQGEMRLLADALVGHLLLRDAQLVTLSLLPAGPPLAQAQINQLIGRYPSLTGVRPPPLNLGYLPGGDIALRAFSQDPLKALPPSGPAAALQRRWQALAPRVAGPAFRNLAGVDLLLVLTAEADDGRAWIEQVSSRTGVPTVIGTSAAAGPGLVPYAAAGQLAGLVEGYDGALAYQALWSPAQGREGRSLCAEPRGRPTVCDTVWPQRWGQLVLLAGLLLGNMAGFWQWLRGGRG